MGNTMNIDTLSFDVYEVLKEIITGVLDKEELLELKTDIFDDLNMSSVQLIQLISECERFFEIEFDDIPTESGFSTLQEIVQYIVKKQEHQDV